MIFKNIYNFSLFQVKYFDSTGNSKIHWCTALKRLYNDSLVDQAKSRFVGVFCVFIRSYAVYSGVQDQCSKCSNW